MNFAVAVELVDKYAQSTRGLSVDISLEGKLLSGAFVAATITALTGNAWLGLGCAMC